jgi:hypothetical protein
MPSHLHLVHTVAGRDQSAQNTQALQLKSEPIAGLSLEAIQSLAISDPDLLEQQRRDAIESLIMSDPDLERHMRSLQFRIDMEIRRSKTPLQACLRLSSLMWDEFLKMNDALNLLSTNPTPFLPQSMQKSAKVLHLPEHPTRHAHPHALQKNTEGAQWTSD